MWRLPVSPVFVDLSGGYLYTAGTRRHLALVLP